MMRFSLLASFFFNFLLVYSGLHNYFLFPLLQLLTFHHCRSCICESVALQRIRIPDISCSMFWKPYQHQQEARSIRRSYRHSESCLTNAEEASRIGKITFTTWLESLSLQHFYAFFLLDILYYVGQDNTISV